LKRIKLPTGLCDEFGIVAEQRDILSQQLLAAFRHKGYTRIATPLLEQEKLFQNYELKDQMYKFTDADGRSLVLRPDLTLPIARFLANNNVSLPRKFYYLGEKFSIGQQFMGQRNELTQAGVELVGFNSIKAEIECLLIIHWINRQFLNNQLTIELGDAQLVTKVLSNLNISATKQAAIATALFAKNFPRYQELIKGFITNPLYPFLKKWPRLFGSVEGIEDELADVQLPSLAKPIVANLLKLAKFVQHNFADQQVIIDLSSAVPQKYYTGVIFKAYMAQINNYVISGGRYDQLLANFQQKSEAAVGLGINIDLLTKLSNPPLAEKNKLVFAPLQAYPTALKLVNENDNYSLALADNLAGAKQEAATAGMDLITIGGE